MLIDQDAIAKEPEKRSVDVWQEGKLHKGEVTVHLLAQEKPVRCGVVVECIGLGGEETDKGQLD